MGSACDARGVLFVEARQTSIAEGEAMVMTAGLEAGH